MKDLFGGAIHADIPAGWRDLSDFRPVPDHQEVFFDDGIMLTVELCEMLADGLAQAMRTHFVELVVQSDGVQEKIEDVAQGVVSGSYCMRTSSRVELKLCVLRKTKFKTDIVVSLAGPSVDVALLRGVVDSLRIVNEGLFRDKV